MSWLATVLVMAPLVTLGLRSSFVQDVMIEMPSHMPSVKNLRWLVLLCLQFLSWFFNGGKMLRER